jgi:6-phosphogluconolactonase
VTGEPSIRIERNAGATSQAAAEVIAHTLRQAVEERGRADWATTGGSTPVGIYRALRVPPLHDLVPWASVHVWWGDDRFVPSGDPLSNVRPFDTELLPAVGLAPEHVHAMPMDAALSTAAGPESVAIAYETELRAADLALGAAGFPILDVVLVGIGGDGHVLSVFPGSPLLGGRDWVSAVPAPTHIEPHVPRVSLHPEILAGARVPMVVAHGPGKAAILGSVLGPERDPHRWPAQVARRTGAIWFLDRDAAAGLPG